MATVEERIEKVKPYFKGLNVDGTIIYMLITFPNGWMVNSVVLDEKFHVKVSLMENTKSSFYFFTEITNGFDCVFDAIEFTVKHNEDAQQKADFFRLKVMELQKIVEDEDMEILQTLKFTMDNRKRKTGVKKKENTPPPSEIIPEKETKEIKEIKEPSKIEPINETPEDIDKLIATAKVKNKKK